MSGWAEDSTKITTQKNIGILTTTPNCALDVAGTARTQKIQIRDDGVCELGYGVAGKSTMAGKIGYETVAPGALDIVGAGTSATDRKVKIWDALEVDKITSGTSVSRTGAWTLSSPYLTAQLSGLPTDSGVY